MIVTLSSVRGAPGVTSWALLTAAAWPQAFEVERVVLEADLDGGVLGARYGLGVEPGVAGLVAAVRRHAGGTDLDMTAFARHMPDGVWVVPEPESAEQCTVVWSSASTVDGVAAVAAADDRIWVVDAGRSRGVGVAAPFIARSALTVVLCRSSQEDLVQVPTRIAVLQRLTTAVGVMVVGKTAYHRDELAQFFGTGLLWQVEATNDLPAVAGALLSSNRRARRTLLWRSALEVAAGMADRVAAFAGGGTADPQDDFDAEAAIADG
jgi:hypothetical protein